MFRLAVALGMTVGELERRMSSAELSEWLAFEEEYGIGDGYFVAGQVCATTAGVFTGKATSPADYVPFFRRPKRAQTPAEARAIVRAHMAAAKTKRASGRV